MKTAIFAYSRQGCQTARRIMEHLDGEIQAYTMERFEEDGFLPIPRPSHRLYGDCFHWAEALIFVSSCGIAVREIAPYVEDKRTDPAVVAIDELGRFAVPLLSGHIGGANALAKMLAEAIGATPVITTATDIHNRFSVDSWAVKQGYVISSMKRAKDVSAAILERDIPLHSDFPIIGELPNGVVTRKRGSLGICISYRTEEPYEQTLRLIPKNLHLGIGCRKGTAKEAISEAVNKVLMENKIDFRAIRCIASIDLKATEKGLLDYWMEAGIPITFYTAEELQEVKREYIPAIMDAYNSMAEEYDIIVMEGAGSPAEINLKQEDIVNMGMAKLVDAPVLLVGDIDRGGVFAQLYGTVALLEPEEQARIKGTVVNKFRGDKKILAPGIKILEDLCGVPVAGVIPYVHVDVDDEDSLTERFDRVTSRKLLDIAVIRLPRISNFTDFSPFERYENVSVRYVDKVSDLHNPDMILLPGTKSTIADLRWLRQCGLEAAVQKASAAGTLVFGICGGYQMLGTKVSDPDQVEAAGITEIMGLGLLPMETVFHGEKVQTQTEGIFADIQGLLTSLNGLHYEGYEIHMGRSQEAMPPVAGAGNVYGSYVHGIFDAPGVTDAILKAICQQKGIDFEALGTFDMRQYKEQQYDKLADAVRSGLDMDLVYRILNREV